MIYILLLAISLAMDAFAVSVSLSVSSTVTLRKDKIKVAAVFGLFQGVMPLIGYFVVLPFQANYGFIIDLISIILLSLLGIKMIIESFQKQPNECVHDICLKESCDEVSCKKTGKQRKISTKKLFVFAISTSIDALLAGLIIASLAIDMKISVLIIAFVTLLLSYIGINFGKFVKQGLEQKFELVGGLVLIFLALKVALDFFF